MSPVTDQNAHTVARRKYSPRLAGDERREKGRELAVGYVTYQASIRALADQHEMTYGTVRALLLEAGVTLRSRGARFRRGHPA